MMSDILLIIGVACVVAGFYLILGLGAALMAAGAQFIALAILVARRSSRSGVTE